MPQNLDQSLCGFVGMILDRLNFVFVGVPQEDSEKQEAKIKVPNKFRGAKRKAPTNECKCLIFKEWSHLGLNQGLPDYE